MKAAIQRLSGKENPQRLSKHKGTRATRDTTKLVEETAYGIYR